MIECPWVWRRHTRPPEPHGARLDCRPRGARPQPARTSTSICPAIAWSSSPGCPGRASRRWPSTPSTPKGQRRYVESLSAYARQFLEQMEKPDVDLIDGLSPAISIEQKTTGVQPAIDGRHRHRDLRLPAAAVRQHRRAALPELRSRDLVAVARADHGHGDALSARRAHQRARAGRARPQGRVQAGAGGASRRGIHARAHRRQFVALERRHHARSAQEPHDRRARRSAHRQARHRAAAVRLDRARAEARRRHRRHQHARGRRSAVLAPDGVSGLRHQHSGDDAARVLVQLAARRVPGVPGARRGLRLRSRAHRARRHAVAREGRDRAVGEGRRRSDRRDARRAAGARSASIRRCRSRSCRRSCATSCCSARRASARRTAAAKGRRRRIRSAPTSRAPCRTCGAGSRKARGPIRKRSSRTARCSRVRPARANGCGPRAARSA